MTHRSILACYGRRMKNLILLFVFLCLNAFAQQQVPSNQAAVDLQFNGIGKCADDSKEMIHISKTGADCLEMRNGVGILPVRVRITRDGLNGSGQISLDALKAILVRASMFGRSDDGKSYGGGEIEGPGFELRRFFTENGIAQTRNIQILQVKLTAGTKLTDAIDIEAEIYWGMNVNMKNRNDNLDFDVKNYEAFKDTVCPQCTSSDPSGTLLAKQMGASITVKALDRISFIAFAQRYSNYTYANMADPNNPRSNGTMDYSFGELMEQLRSGFEIDVSVLKNPKLYNIMLFARAEMLTNTKTFDYSNYFNSYPGDQTKSVESKPTKYNLISFGIKAVIR